MFKRLSDFVPKAIHHLGLAKQTSGAHVCQAFRVIAPTVIHELALEHIHPRFFKNGVLAIGVDASAWGQLVTDKKVAIIEAVNERVGSQLVKNLRTAIHKKTPQDDLQN